MTAEAVKTWRKRTKTRIIDSFGGSCGICGYNKCQSALELHHLDQTTKEFGFGSVRATALSWDKICKELRKCILVCSNCHKEIHEDLVSIPENIHRFNEEYADYKAKQKAEFYDDCPVCGTKKPKTNKTCSHKCAATLANKADWDSINLEDLLIKHSKVEIGKMLGVSDKAVHKRAKKLGIDKIRKTKIDWDSIDLKDLLSKYSKRKIGKMLGVSEKVIYRRAKKLCTKD